MKQKRIVETLLCVMIAGSVFSTSDILTTQADTNNITNNITANQFTRDNFIALISPVVQQIANSNDLYPSLMVAQATLESFYGQSELTQNANNLFGIKSFNNQGYLVPTNEFDQQQNKYIVIDDYFKSYPSISDGLMGYVNFLNNPIYANVHRSVASNSLEAAYNIQQDGYATDPNYAERLIKLIKAYNLEQLDSQYSKNGLGSTTSNASQTSNNEGNQNSSNQTSNTVDSLSSQNNTSNQSNQNTNSSVTTNTTNTTNQGTTKMNHSATSKKLISHHGIKPTITYSYVSGNNDELVLLSSRFSHYNLYTHIKDAIQNHKDIIWPSDFNAGQQVYVVKKARVQSKGKINNLYQIRFSVNGHEKWVDEKALSFPKIRYTRETKKLKVKSDAPVYNHAWNTKSLVQFQGNIMAGTKIMTNRAASYKVNGKIVKWYNVNNKNGMHGWIDEKFLSGIKKIKNKIYYTKVKQFAYVKPNARYHAFKHLQGSFQHRAKVYVNFPKIKKVYVNLKGTNHNHHIWYRVRFHAHNYWVAAKSLIFNSK